MNINSYIKIKKLLKRLALLIKKFLLKRQISLMKLLYVNSQQISQFKQVFQFLQITCKKYKTKIIAYNSDIQRNFKSKVKKFLNKNLYYNYNYKLYRSFNVLDFIFIENKIKIKLNQIA